VPEYHRGSRRRAVNGLTRRPDRSEVDNVLVVTRGHPFARDPFFEIFESNPAIEWSSIEHPAAQQAFTPEFAAGFDCYVLYDMPGIVFRPGGAPEFYPPPQDYVDGLMSMCDGGFPLVILHHACAAWPAWPEWAEIVGGHFLYQPGHSRGVDVPDSGYVIDVPQVVTPVADHPITAGIEPFDLVDELYLAHVFEDSITPLFTSDFEFVDSNFYSAANALEGRLNDRSGWSHAPGSNIVGWVKTYRNSPIVYLQFGDGPATYGNETFRQVLANAIAWACSPEAREWADAG
jgi:type 1 glutamine amidotransferase